MHRSWLLLTLFAVACSGPPKAQGQDVRCDTDADCTDLGPTFLCQVEANLCTVVTSCGNKVTDLANGEECDDGNQDRGDGCSPECLIEPPESCGDGVLDLDQDEQCDDGGLKNGDGCSKSCRFEIVGLSCGDGKKDEAEACDNGSDANGDICDADDPAQVSCRCSPACTCGATCNFTGTTTLFAGKPGTPGSADGDRLSAALLKGSAVLAGTDDALYFSEEGNPVVRRLDLASGQVETIAGSGVSGYADDSKGLQAQFGFIEAIATDGKTLWVADVGNHVIRSVDLTNDTFPVNTVAGVQYTGAGTRYHDDPNAMKAEFGGMRGLTHYNRVLYLLAPDQATLRSFSLESGEVKTLAGSPGQQGQTDGCGDQARFISPRYMASDSAGTLYIADTNGNQIRSFNTRTGCVEKFVGSGAQGYLDGVGVAANVHRPRGLTSDGTSLYWVEFNAHTVRQADFATRTVTTLVGLPAPSDCTGGGYAEGTGSDARFRCPFTAYYHFPSRSIFVSDGGNAVIRQIK